MTELDARLRIQPLAHRMIWIMIVRAFDVHGIGRCRWLEAARDLDKLSTLAGLPASDVREAIERFEAIGLLRRNGSGDIFIPGIFFSMSNLRRQWRRDRQQLVLKAEVSA